VNGDRTALDSDIRDALKTKTRPRGIKPFSGTERSRGSENRYISHASSKRRLRNLPHERWRARVNRRLREHTARTHAASKTRYPSTWWSRRWKRSTRWKLVYKMSRGERRDVLAHRGPSAQSDVQPQSLICQGIPVSVD